jgi:hypothetical protein
VMLWASWYFIDNIKIHLDLVSDSYSDLIMIKR